jgi:hypothetical protein
MSLAVSNVRVGQPSRFGALSVFPLFDGAHTPVEYLLSDEGILSGSVTVEEVSEGGSVPDLLVENRGDVRVLFLEGEQLVGAKQNRILNTSVLVAAHTKIKIPVSCVEQGRWRYRSRHFGSSGTHSPAKLRHFLKMSVSKSVAEKRGHRSDQNKVWEEVARQQKSLGTSSATGAMSDTFDAYKERVAEFQDTLRYVDGASGMAVAIGRKIVAVDIFDKPSTCGRVWGRLMSGFALDALEEPADQEQAGAGDVEQLLATADRLPWEKADSVGEGEEYRAQRGEEIHASALALQDAPVHVSVMVAG